MEEIKKETNKTPIPSEKLNALRAAMDKIEKNYGKGAIMKLGDDQVEEIAVIPTGSIGLNAALGVGGYPRGRVIEIYGPESSGKTTLAIHAIAEAQKAGGIAAIIDAEHAFDRFYAEKLGVDVENLWISQPDSGEQALEIAEQLIRSSAVDIVVIDSVAALTPKAELEGDMGDSKMGLQARLMSQALRKLTATISKTNTTCIFINQLRDKLGVMFGNPETTTGGNALKFYASVRLDIRRISQIKDGEEVIGNQTRVKVVKNKVAPPFRRPSSTSCSVKEFPVLEKSSIWVWIKVLSRKAVLGSVTTIRSWGRVEMRQRSAYKTIPNWPMSWNLLLWKPSKPGNSYIYRTEKSGRKLPDFFMLFLYLRRQSILWFFRYSWAIHALKAAGFLYTFIGEKIFKIFSPMNVRVFY